MLLLAAGGCGKPASEVHPVSGRVILPNGSSATSGVIEFRTVDAEGKTVNASGMIESDGTFHLSTFGNKDGALTGKHQAILLSPAVGDGDVVAQAPAFPAKYRGYDTSSLEFEVKPGENQLEIKLD